MTTNPLGAHMFNKLRRSGKIICLLGLIVHPIGSLLIYMTMQRAQRVMSYKTHA